MACSSAREDPLQQSPDERLAAPGWKPPAGEPGGEPVFCTMDAKECPDGSFVGRIGPNCEFAPCP